MPAKADCTIPYATDFASVDTVVRQYGRFDFKNYDRVCNKLKEADAKVFITGGYGVLSGRSYAWTVLTLEDRGNKHIRSHEASLSRSGLHPDASTPKARELLWESINDSLNDWGKDYALDDAIYGLREAYFALESSFLNKYEKFICNNPATQR